MPPCACRHWKEVLPGKVVSPCWPRYPEMESGLVRDWWPGLKAACRVLEGAGPHPVRHCLRDVYIGQFAQCHAYLASWHSFPVVDLLYRAWSCPSESTSLLSAQCVQPGSPYLRDRSCLSLADVLEVVCLCSCTFQAKSWIDKATVSLLPRVIHIPSNTTFLSFFFFKSFLDF